MTFAPIVDQIRESGQRGNRTGSIIRFVWHHQASTNDDNTIGAMVSGSRQVSATYTVNSDNPGNRGWSRITGVVPEEYRPWTSNSALVDGRALTVECCNSSGDPTWGIADTSHEACARLAAYAFTQYGVPLRRITSSSNTAGHIGHNELPAIFTGESSLYPTFCPGNLDIDRILARAQEIVNGDDLVTDAQYNQLRADIGYIRDQILPVVQTNQHLISVNQAMLSEQQQFRLFRLMDPNVPANDEGYVKQWTSLARPGMFWHVPNGNVLALIQKYRLAGAAIDVEVYDEWLGLVQLFALLEGDGDAEQNAKIIALLEKLSLPAGSTGEPMTAAEIVKTLADAIPAPESKEK